jgi:hypothetical protein
MTKRKFLQQEIDDYQKAMGPYDALAEVFNQSLDSAKAGTPYAYRAPSGAGWYVTKGAKGDGGLQMRTSAEAAAVGVAASEEYSGLYPTAQKTVQTGWKGVQKEQIDPETGQKYMTTVAEPVYKTVESGYMAVQGVGRDLDEGDLAGIKDGQFIADPSANKILPIFPNAPDPTKFSNGPPSFTKSEERTLNGEQTFTEMDRNSKGLLDRIKAQDEWRPSANSNLGLLQKVLQGKA